MQKLDLSGEKPIFLQIDESLEDAVLSGALPEGGQLPSITELSVQYTINPATALKGINLLVDQGAAYKKRKGPGLCCKRSAEESSPAALWPPWRQRPSGWAFPGRSCWTW